MTVREQFGLPGDLMAYVLLVVAVAFVGGTGAGLAAAVTSGFVVNWYLTVLHHAHHRRGREHRCAAVVRGRGRGGEPAIRN